MSIEVVAHVLQHSPLSGNPKVLLLGLANHAAPDGTNARPAVATLAGYARVDRRTVQRQLKAMVAGGHIAVDGVWRNGETVYRVVMPCPSDDVADVPSAQPEDLAGGRQLAAPADPPGGRQIAARGAASVPPGGAAPVPPEPSFEPSQQERDAPERAIVARLQAHCRSIDPRASIDEAAWSADAAALVRLRPGLELEQLLEWALGDLFWTTRVLSPGHLARHATAITAARARSTGSPAAWKPLMRSAGRDPGACCAARGERPHAAEAAWKDIAGRLRQNVGDSTYDIWFAAAHPHVNEDGELLLAADAPVADWIGERFATALTAAAGRTVEIVVCQEASA